MVGFRSGIAAAVGVFLTLSSFAGTSGRLQTKLFPPDPHSCALKRASLGQITFDSPKSTQDGFAEADRIEMVSAIAETSDPSCLKDYAFVQWVRGCVYSQTYDRRTKTKENGFGYSRDLRGKDVPFVHRTWEVDAMGADPMYWAAPANTATDPKRFDYYRVPKSKIDFSQEKPALASIEHLVNFSSAYTMSMEMKKPFSLQSVKDSPTHASWRENRYNVNLEQLTVSSLEFHMCIYHTRDVPLTGDPANFDVPESRGGPITCFDWSAKNRWNYETQKIETFDQMDPQCGIESMAATAP